MNDAHRYTFPQLDADGNWFNERGSIRTEVYDWLRENCLPVALREGGDHHDTAQWRDMYCVKQGRIRDPIYVWFHDPNDAVNFRLCWG